MSRKSGPRGPYKMPLSSEELFWGKVDKSGECWLWLAGRKGGKCGRKYGSFITGGRLHKKQWYAHRYSYFLANGSIPDNLDIMHACDNGLCVNPAHLIAGTTRDNMCDAYKKNRLKSFNKIPIATHEERVQIMQMVSDGTDVATITAKFDLPKNYVHRLKTGYRGAYLTYTKP